MQMSNIRVLIAEDHRTVREGLEMILKAQPDIEVVGEAGDGQAAIDMAKALNPDIVIMDVSMPQLNGLKATRELQRCLPQVKVLTLTRHKDDGYLQQLLRAGVSGYVLKQSSSTELLQAIRAIAAGGQYVDSALTHRVVGGFVEKSGVRNARHNVNPANERVKCCA